MSYQVAHRMLLNMRDVSFLVQSSLAKLHPTYTKQSILCNSFGKSGTHLLSQILEQVPGYKLWNDIVAMQSLSGVINTPSHVSWKLASAPGGSIIRSHLTYVPEVLEILSRRKYKRLFIYRDLRDVALSYANWVMKEPRYYLNGTFKRRITSNDQRLMIAICGLPLGSRLGTDESYPSIFQHFAQYLGWLKDPNTLAIKFEDIVGEKGNGDDNSRIKTIFDILDFLECDIPVSERSKIFSPDKFDPGQSHTFRKGRKGEIGGWRSQFNEEHIKAFKNVAGDLLIELGYESNLLW